MKKRGERKTAMKIRKSTLQDLPVMMEIYAFARKFMAQHGNPDQWGPNQWPPEELLRKDIAEGSSYVCENDAGKVTGTFFFAFGPDIEPAYRKITEGVWLDDSPYGVIHRIASDGSEKGTGTFCVNWAYERCGHLRIDTHGDNTVMQNFVSKLGFVHCGTIYVEQDDAPRLAYEKSAVTAGGAFRPMRRIKQQTSREECIRILREEKRGVLSMTGENGYPYGIPMNHWYSPEDGKLYFHGAKAGHKIDAVTKDSRVSYCVYDAGYRREGEWALNVNSVVVFGRISLVTDEGKAAEICENLCRKFTDDEEYIRKELAGALPRVQCLELTIDHMTGKLVNES